MHFCILFLPYGETWNALQLGFAFLINSEGRFDDRLAFRCNRPWLLSLSLRKETIKKILVAATAYKDSAAAIRDCLMPTSTILISVNPVRTD